MRVQLAPLAPPMPVIARVLPFCRAVQETVLQGERGGAERIPLNRAGIQARGLLERVGAAICCQLETQMRQQ